MPTVHGEGVFVLKVYGPPREHPPPHVHVEVGVNGLVVIRLGLHSSDSPKVWQAYNVSDAELLTAYRLVEKHERELRRNWEQLHG